MVDICGQRYYDNRHQNFFYALEEVKGTTILRGIKTDDRLCTNSWGDRKKNKRNTYVVERKDLQKIKHHERRKPQSQEDVFVRKLMGWMDYALNNGQKRLYAKCVKFMINIGERNAKGRIKIL